MLILIQNLRQLFTRQLLDIGQDDKYELSLDISSLGQKLKRIPLDVVLVRSLRKYEQRDVPSTGRTITRLDALKISLKGLEIVRD